MRTIPMYVESPNGHDTIDVPEDDLQDDVEKQLKDDKWVTTEKEDGSTEILTEADIPKTKTLSSTVLEKTEEQEWAEKFENVKSATVTNKAKGG